MRVLVTGAGGFVGRALIAALGDAHEVVAVDRSCAGLKAATMVEGDLADAAVLGAALAEPVDAVVHLATVPGGAAEQDPAEAWRVNIEATGALLRGIVAQGGRPRVLFASSIAIFGDSLPDRVDDATPVRPTMLYGAHKAMIEQWIAVLTRRGEIDGLSLRLPGIVARPRAPSGMKSAFMSEIFHAALADEPFVSPVSPQATVWLMSARRIADNLRRGLERAGPTGEPFALTLPALRISMAELVAEIAAQTGYDPARVSYAPDPALEAGFGRQPPLSAQRAAAFGFSNDAAASSLVREALDGIGKKG